MSKAFVHLHNHTHYSLLSAACRIGDLVRTSKEMGMDSVAVTDQGSLFGAVDFFETAKSQGVRPILGCELYLKADGAPDRPPGMNEHRYATSVDHALVVLAKSDLGYQNLMKLSSAGYLESDGYRPTLAFEKLSQHAEGLIGLSGGVTGEIPKLLLAEDYEGARTAAFRYRDLFGEDFYLELVDHGTPEHRLLVNRLTDLSKDTALPLVVTNHVHYLAEHHADAHDALLCIQTGSQTTDETRFRYPTREMYFKTPEQMYDLFPEHVEALENTVKIAERCQVELEFGNLKLPPFPKPDEFETLDDYLTHLCQEGLAGRYEEITAELQERLDFELEIIHQMGYSGYFLITMDFIRYARSIGVPVGPGRGSAAGSLVSYSLGITNIDPMRYSLLFERFLNPERVSMPDIDVDFSDRGRGKVIQYVVEKYGVDNVCQIITFGTMAARAAVRDVGRVMGIAYQEVDRLAKMVPAEIGIKLEKALETSPDLRTRYEADPQVHELVNTALVVEGLSRHASTHAAGVIITPSALTEYVPLYRAGEDEITTQFDMNACDKIGLLKMDFLGLRTLTVLEDCLAMLKDRDIEVDLEDVDLENPESYALFSRGETVGVFQFESSGMTEYLRKLKPEVIEDLIAMNALYRPGPLGSGMIDDFILRKHGAKKIKYEHPVLEPILKDTYGVIVYQEQVMQIASAMAGYSLGEADLLRRAMGKKKVEVMKEHRATFVSRSVENRVPQRTAETVFDLMAHFAGYGFNKSHSAGYALVAYQTAYLKAHYPVEFMAASLTSEMSNSDRIKILLNEVRRMGIELLPPDLNRSFDPFTVENGAIRFGMGAVKGVGHGAVASICEAREKGGPFTELFDLAERVDAIVNRKCFEALILAGALDSFGWPRARMVEALAVLLEWAARRRREKELGQGSLFGGGSAAPAPKPVLPDVPEWEMAEKLTKEKSALGFYVTGHPMNEFERLIESTRPKSSTELLEMGKADEVTFCGLPVAVKFSVDKKGRALAFATVEDFVGAMECIFFEEPLEHAKEVLSSEEPIVIKGRLSARKEETPKIVATEGKGLRFLIEKGRYSFHIAVSTQAADGQLASIRQLLEGHAGNCPVYLHVNHQAMDGLILRSRSLRVRPTNELIDEMKALIGEHAVRVVAGEKENFRSVEVFGRALPKRPPEADPRPVPPTEETALADA